MTRAVTNPSPDEPIESFGNASKFFVPPSRSESIEYAMCTK